MCSVMCSNGMHKCIAKVSAKWELPAHMHVLAVQDGDGLLPSLLTWPLQQVNHCKLCCICNMRLGVYQKSLHMTSACAIMSIQLQV